MAGNARIHSQNDRGKLQVAVVIVPFPAQGHLNQLLQLSRLISAYHIPVHYVCTSSHGRQAKSRVQCWDPLSIANIHFHEFSTPSFVSPPPNPYASIKFPSHLQPSFDSSIHLREPVARLLQQLSSTSRRVVVIHDSLMGSVVQDFATLPNAESYTFHSVSAFCMFFFLWEGMGKPFPIDEEILKLVLPMDGCFTPEFIKFLKYQHEYIKFSSGRIYNACKVIEGPFLDLLARKEISKNKKHWALGPFNPVTIREQRRSSEEQREYCLKWLDKQSPKSVVFVSFGTTTSLSDEQIREITIGLEKSEQKFAWALRDADKGDVFVEGCRRIALPQGFVRRVEGKGLVVRNWAPQLEILGHSATGGFMSHCGWNSCMESLTMGVPILAWPMHSDQPRNATLITKILRVGLSVKDWNGRDEVVKASMVEKAVRDLMAPDSEIGGELRKRAAELGAASRRSVAEGGLTREELDSFVSHITR